MRNPALLLFQRTQSKAIESSLFSLLRPHWMSYSSHISTSYLPQSHICYYMDEPGEIGLWSDRPATEAASPMAAHVWVVSWFAQFAVVVLWVRFMFEDRAYSARFRTNRPKDRGDRDWGAERDGFELSVPLDSARSRLLAPVLENIREEIQGFTPVRRIGRAPATRPLNYPLQRVDAVVRNPETSRITQMDIRDLVEAFEKQRKELEAAFQRVVDDAAKRLEPLRNELIAAQNKAIEQAKRCANRPGQQSLSYKTTSASPPRRL